MIFWSFIKTFSDTDGRLMFFLQWLWSLSQDFTGIIDILLNTMDESTAEKNQIIYVFERGTNESLLFCFKFLCKREHLFLLQWNISALGCTWVVWTPGEDLFLWLISIQPSFTMVDSNIQWVHLLKYCTFWGTCILLKWTNLIRA